MQVWNRAYAQILTSKRPNAVAITVKRLLLSFPAGFLLHLSPAHAKHFALLQLENSGFRESVHGVTAGWTQPCSWLTTVLSGKGEFC